MTQQTRNHAEKTTELLAQVNKFQEYHWKLHAKNKRLASLLVVLGVLLSGATTAAGFMSYPQLAGFLGLGTTLFIALHDAFNFSEKSQFFNEVHVQAKIIRDKLKYQTSSDEDFNRAFNEFQSLREHSSRNIPQGKGISVAKRINSDTAAST
jgi:hypothetical protein